MLQQADSIEGWIKLARQNCQAAHALKQMDGPRNLAWTSAGFAVECILKASIMAKERLNRYPSRSDRRELYDHDLERLSRVLGLQIISTDEIAPFWAVVLQWRREHTYVDGEMPEVVVRELVDAVFSEDGVIPWLCGSYLRSYIEPEKNIWTG